MAICLKCGRESEYCLCESCKAGVDLEALCRELIAYRPGSGENPIWEKLCSEFDDPYDLRKLVFAVSEDLPAPRKEYLRVMAITGASSNVSKDSRPWFYEVYGSIIDDDGLTTAEKNRLHGIAVGAYYMDYDYFTADRIASQLCESDDIPWQACYNLAEFYTTTRRYDVAEEVIVNALQRFANNPFVVQTMQNRMEKNTKQREKAEAGKQEYMPNPKENKEEARRIYIDFLASIGIEAAVPKPKKKAVAAIPRDQYPDPVETRDTDFDTFVAFDLETTGRSPKIDSIIEFGAVRVVNGQVTENAEFTFQEIAKPFERRLSEEIKRITGITEDDVKDAREMWEVFADFMRFVGNDVLVGFNCMAFDSRFMVRAGRYANIIIENKYFDVMRYADSFKARLGIDAKKTSLAELSEKLDIENPQAHRALADAITTAKVFLRLKEMDDSADRTSISNQLSDLDKW